MKRIMKAGSARRLASRGVTLVELLVGMTIGLLSVVIITQVMAVSEEQKRTTSSGSDAQVNGALALSSLQREVTANRELEMLRPEGRTLNGEC